MTRKQRNVGTLRDVVFAADGELRAVLLEGGERVPFDASSASLPSAAPPPEPLGSPTVMEQRDAAVAAGLRARATHALRQRHNWAQLAKFCVVGASGYVVNLAVYTALLNGADLDYRAGGDRLVRRRRHEQLPLEPALDVPARARALRLPGPALLRRRAARVRREPA